MNRTEPVLITITFKCIYIRTVTRKTFAETQNLTTKQAVLFNTGKNVLYLRIILAVNQAAIMQDLKQITNCRGSCIRTMIFFLSLKVQCSHYYESTDTSIVLKAQPWPCWCLPKRIRSWKPAEFKQNTMMCREKKPILVYEENEKYRDDLKPINAGDAKTHLDVLWLAETQWGIPLWI